MDEENRYVINRNRLKLGMHKQIEEEQSQLDERLRDQQLYTRSLIESIFDAIMITDPSGIITDVNKQVVQNDR
jgi:PAS domain-containing protein